MSAAARALCAAAAVACLAAPSATSSAQASAPREVVVSYASKAELSGLRVLRRIPALHAAVVETRGGIRGQTPVLRRTLSVSAPALEQTFLPGVAWEWQWDAADMDAVPDSALRDASRVKVAVIDSGADLSAPNIGDKAPATWSVLSHSQRVRDVFGHGTFVASIAAGSVRDGVGIAGFGGDAKLLVIQAIDRDGYVTDVDEAAAIVYAVKHGADVINLSIGGSDTSAIEKRAVRWAARRGALIVAAAGNEHDDGNPTEYPAALLQPRGSNGRGGMGLAVGAADRGGARPSFSNTGSYLSLVAPGVNVFADESAASAWPHAQVPWASPGFYGWASGTSFSAPEVAGVAALVWGANPLLTARQVAEVIKRSADGSGWTPELGWGSLDAGAAVTLAQATHGKALRTASRRPHRR